MLENVPKTTDTMGTVSRSETLYSGQANTRTYSVSEKQQVLKTRDHKELGQDWDNPAVGQILSQNTNN